MRNGSESPVEYPKISIGGEILTVKIDLLAELIISRAGLSIDEAINPLRVGSKNPRNLDYLFQLFAAAVAHNYKQMGLVVLTADEWVSKVEAAGGPDGAVPILTEMRKVLTEAVLKQWPHLRAVPVEAAKPLEAAPLSEKPQ